MRPSQSHRVSPTRETIAKPCKTATRFPSPSMGKGQAAAESPLPRWERVRVRVIGVDKGEGYGKTALTQSSNTTSNLTHLRPKSLAMVR